MMKKDNLVLIGVVLALVMGGLALFNGPNDGRDGYDGRDAVGAIPGPDVYQHMYFNAGATTGTRVATTSTASTYTMNIKDFRGTPTYIDWLPNVDITISLSATSTRDYVPNVGDVAVQYWRNASTTAAATITFAAADAGLDLQKNEDVADLALLGLDVARITYVRESLNLVTAIYEEFLEAD